MELADVTDSKSVDGDIVRVRVPPPAPVECLDTQIAFGAFFFFELISRVRDDIFFMTY